MRSEEHTSELQSPCNLVCRLLLEKKKKNRYTLYTFTVERCVISFYAYIFTILFSLYFFFFFNDTATTEIYTLSLHDALPISGRTPPRDPAARAAAGPPRSTALRRGGGSSRSAAASRWRRDPCRPAPAPSP